MTRTERKIDKLKDLIAKEDRGRDEMSAIQNPMLECSDDIQIMTRGQSKVLCRVLRSTFGISKERLLLWRRSGGAVIRYGGAR